MLTPNNSYGLAMLIVLCVGFSLPAAAQSSSNQFWPEVEGYYSFNQQLRLGVLASRSTDGASYNSIEVGSTLNFFAKRFVRPVLSTPNEAQNHSLVFGVGYRYMAGINQAPENQDRTRFRASIPLATSIQASDRNRIDLRFIESSGFFWRYRNQISLQRTFTIIRFTFSPYAQGEFFYSSSSEVGTRRHFKRERIFRFANILSSNPIMSATKITVPFPMR